ncbi:uncharacterized protein LOC117046393, partial [Lacerta agilis]|uniref:uncharacterized protein LOC117046393 n=1 Tax=Lacerta agilis TaxID=80427 RepID=UPI0014193E1C
MASLLPLPSYSPATESWESYLEQFECYLEANAFTDLTDSQETALFLTVCGSEVFETAQALVAPLAMQAAAWDTLMEKLKGHYAPKISRIAAHHVFHHRIQIEGETICEFLSGRLHITSDLTLKHAIEEAQAVEAAKHSTTEIRKGNSPTIPKKLTPVHHGEISESKSCSDEEDDICHIKQEHGKVKGNKKSLARYANKDCHAFTNYRCSAELTVVRADGSEHWKIYVTVTIEGKPCDMEVDTGSSLSIVSWRARICLGMQLAKIEIFIFLTNLLRAFSFQLPEGVKEINQEAIGIVRMKALARSYVWWPGIDAEIEGWVKRCEPCQVSRPDPPKAPVQSWEPTQSPWSRVHVDFVGPFQGQHFLIVVDSQSKWLEVVPTSTVSTRATINALRKLFATHGLPDTLVSDNGTAFTSAEFKEFLRLAEFLLAQHTTPSVVTGRSPAELLMGRRLTTLLDHMHPDRALEQRPSTVVQGAPRGFFPGDTVYVRNYGPGQGWVPGTIARCTGPVSYEVGLEGGLVWKRHLDQIRTRTSPNR